MEKVTKGLTNWLSSEGMTQKDVAEKLGVSEQFVNALFNGRREFGKISNKIKKKIQKRNKKRGYAYFG